jgi:hypothetical protein
MEGEGIIRKGGKRVLGIITLLGYMKMCTVSYAQQQGNIRPKALLFKNGIKTAVKGKE